MQGRGFFSKQNYLNIKRNNVNFFNTYSTKPIGLPTFYSRASEPIGPLTYQRQVELSLEALTRKNTYVWEEVEKLCKHTQIMKQKLQVIESELATIEDNPPPISKLK